MTLNIPDGEFFINDENSLWKGSSLYELYKKAYTPWEWHKPIFDRCKNLGLIYFSTPFDESAVEFLETLDVPCYKIASFENIDIPLIRRVAQTGKPMIISTGLATISELDEAVRTARENGCNDIVLLKCTSSYPASPEDSNLLTIPHMRELFGRQVGLSDHSVGIGVAIAAVALGATVIEKHFTLSRTAGGVDAAFSLEPYELKTLVIEAERAWSAVGKIYYEVGESEKRSAQYRRSLYIAQDMKVGDKCTKENICIIRPGFGLSPKYYDMILGTRVSCDLKKGTPVSWNMLRDDR